MALDPSSPAKLLQSYKSAKASLPEISIPSAPTVCDDESSSKIADVIRNTPPDEWIEESIAMVEDSPELAKAYIQEKLKEWMDTLEEKFSEMYDPIKDEMDRKIEEMATVEESKMEETVEVTTAVAMDPSVETVGGDSLVQPAETKESSVIQAMAQEKHSTIVELYLMKAKAQFMAMQAQIAASTVAIAKALSDKVSLITELITAVGKLPVTTVA